MNILEMAYRLFDDNSLIATNNRGVEYFVYENEKGTKFIVQKGSTTPLSFMLNKNETWTVRSNKERKLRKMSFGEAYYIYLYKNNYLSSLNLKCVLDGSYFTGGLSLSHFKSEWTIEGHFEEEGDISGA